LIVEKSTERGEIERTDSVRRLTEEAIQDSEKRGLGLPARCRGKHDGVAAFSSGANCEFLNRPEFAPSQPMGNGVA
jgi:hypothetical protein